MPGKFKFTAFISYSHADAKAVSQLHRALEGYRLPKHLVGQKTSLGPIPKKMPPFFKDREDLSAATNLTESVKKALRNSKFLIVVCSPDSAKSKWVDKEIRVFEKIRGRDYILCLIVGDKTPGAKGVKAIDCFPPRILQMKARGDYEPIAADARPEGDGKRLAKLKLIAGLLGIELDQLIQRDAQRRQRRQATVMAFSLLGVVVLSVLLWFAIEARKEAETNRRIAEDRQFQAESLVEYMLGDLRENLAPIGSLEMMDTLAIQALGYYSSLDPESMTTDALSRRSEVLRMLGDIQKQRGNSEQAIAAFNEAFLTTEELLARDSQNPERIFDHSQSVFFLAEMDLRQGALEEAEKKFRLYDDYANQLASLDPGNRDYVMEVGFSHSNLGTLFISQGRFEEAEEEFQKQLDVFQKLAGTNSNPGEFDYDLAQSYAWLSDSQLGLGKFILAQKNRELEGEIYKRLLDQNPLDSLILWSSVVNIERLGLIHAFLGQMKTSASFFQKGMEVGEQVISFDPENTGTKADVSRLIIDFIEFYDFEPTGIGKEVLIDRAQELSANLLEKDNDRFDWRLLRDKALLLQAQNLIQKGQVNQGIEIGERVFKNLQKFWVEENQNFQIFEPIGLAALVLAQGYQSTGRLEAAKKILESFTEKAAQLEHGMTIRAHDYLARAWFLLGQKDKARQKQDFLKNLGYNNPAFTSFLSMGARN